MAMVIFQQTELLGEEQLKGAVYTQAISSNMSIEAYGSEPQNDVMERGPSQQAIQSQQQDREAGKGAKMREWFVVLEVAQSNVVDRETGGRVSN